MVLEEVHQEIKTRQTSAPTKSSEGEGGGGEGEGGGEGVGGGEGAGGGRVLVVVNDERTCYQLRQVELEHLRAVDTVSFLPPSLSSTCVVVGMVFWSSSSRSSCLPSTLSMCWEVWQGVWQGVEPGKERDPIPRD